MKRFLSLICIALVSSSIAFAKGEKQTVVFDVDLHCQGCVSKIEKNIAFEKGVKDLICDLKTKQVTVVFDASKTTVAALQEAFKKIGKPAMVNVKATKEANGGKCPSGVCEGKGGCQGQGACHSGNGGSCGGHEGSAHQHEGHSCEHHSCEHHGK